MQEDRGDAATVAMLAEAKKQAPASTQVSLSPLAASAVVVAEEILTRVPSKHAASCQGGIVG